MHSRGLKDKRKENYLIHNHPIQENLYLLNIIPIYDSVVCIVWLT